MNSNIQMIPKPKSPHSSNYYELTYLHNFNDPNIYHRLDALDEINSLGRFKAYNDSVSLGNQIRINKSRSEPRKFKYLLALLNLHGQSAGHNQYTNKALESGK